MIADAVFALLTTLLEGLAGLLPEGSLDLAAIGSSFQARVAGFLGPMDRFVPTYEMAWFLSIVVLVALPVFATYTLVRWVYRHTPIIGKG